MADGTNATLGIAQTFTNFLNPFLSRLVLSVLILLVGFIIGKLLGTLLKRFLRDIELDKKLRSMHIWFSVEKLLGNLVSFTIYVLTIILSLNNLGLTQVIVTVIFLATLFIIAVSFLLAIKDFFPNLMSGTKIKIKKPFVEGDEIQIKEVKGTVTQVGFLETKIRTAFNEDIIIPNAIFSKRQLIVRKKGQKKAAVNY